LVKWVENGIELEALSEAEIDVEAQKFGETKESITKEAKRLGWSPEYLLLHLRKESRITDVFANLEEEEEEEEEEDDSFIKIVSRNNPIFVNRQMSFTYVKNGNLITDKLPTIPNNVIVCDGCNDLIENDDVGLLMLDLQTCWGTQCKKCRKKYFSSLVVVWDKEGKPPDDKMMTLEEYVKYLNDSYGEDDNDL